MLNGVDQKWFSGYALVEGVEVMLMTPEIRAVDLGFLFASQAQIWRYLTILLPCSLYVYGFVTLFT